jgi:DNA polymerase III sliding clamp (beta) subunit (PCNA family)
MFRKFHLCALRIKNCWEDFEMRFIIQRDRLVQSVQDVMKAVTSRTTIPILTGVKITASSEGVTLTGSDSDISIESFIPNEENGDETSWFYRPSSKVF